MEHQQPKSRQSVHVVCVFVSVVSIDDCQLLSVCLCLRLLSDFQLELIESLISGIKRKAIFFHVHHFSAITVQQAI